MNRLQKPILIFLIFFGIKLFSIECPKDLTVNINSPKAKEEVSGVKQKVTIKINSNADLYYHLIQANQADKNKTKYLQSSGKLESESISNYVWLGNDAQGKNSSFLITVIISKEFIKKEGKVVVWNESMIKPNAICGTSSVEVKRTN